MPSEYIPRRDTVNGTGQFVRVQAEPWLPGTSANAAASWGLSTFANLVVCFVAACHRRDGATLDVICDDMRRVVTRMQSFARIKRREWAGKENTANASDYRNKSE